MSFVISKDIENFTKALNGGLSVDCDRTGVWYEDGLCMRFIRWLFGWEDDRLVRVAAAFNKILDQLEKVPVKFNGSPVEMDAQKQTFHLHLQAAEAVKKRLEEMNTASCNAMQAELALRVAALKYRIEEANGGLSKEEGTASLALFKEVRALAEQWKQGYDLYTEKTLSASELIMLEGVSRYPEFVKLLIKNSGLSSFFFKWSLRDGCSVDAFVQFPSLSAELKNGLMAGRIGKFSSLITLLHQKNLETGEFVKIGESLNPWEKHYTLPVEILEGETLAVKNESLLDEDKVLNLNLNYKQTMKEVVASVANRNRKTGNIEMLGRRRLENGEWLAPRLANYNSIEVAPYNPASKEFELIDLTEKNMGWWKSIPPLDTVEKSELKMLYGINEIKDGEWFAVVRSSREDGELDVVKSHGYLDVLIPDGKGHYMIYPFGKFAAEAFWPVTLIEKALFITDTVPGKVQCPDENHYMPQRQQAKAVVPISDKDGLELMEMIRKDLLEARKGNTVFQFPWENCAWWVQKLMEKLLGPAKHGGPIPNYFRTPLLDARPKNQPLPLLFRICRSFEGTLQDLVVKVIEFSLLAWRGTEVEVKGKKVEKTVMNSGHMKKLEIYHPSSLHEKIKAKQIKESQITMGNLHLIQAAAGAA